MTIDDGWLREQARKRKAEGKTRRLEASGALPPVDGLWKDLQNEIRRQATVYTDALGDPAALVVETPADAIELSVPDGRRLTMRADLAQRRLHETFRNQAGAVRTRRPIIKFSRNAEGTLTFNFGGLQAAAASLLRQVIS